MAYPPLNVFTQQRNPEGALARLRELMPDAEVSLHPDGQWSELKGSWKRGWLKKPLTLKVTHSPDYYMGGEWPLQLAGLAGYLRRFPDAAKRPDVFGYISGLTFALSFLFEPDPVADDPRHDVVHQVLQLLEGVVFLPFCLIDSHGRILVSADGNSDSEAELPAHVPIVADPSSGDAGSDVDEGERPAIRPDAALVSSRLRCMSALVERGFLEDLDDADRDERRLQLTDRLRDAGDWHGLEEWEAEALETTVGMLDQKQRWKLPWLSEGAMVLAWALELATLPPYDEQVDVQVLYELVENLDDAPPLRPLSELETLAFQMLAIHWRLRQYQIEPVATDFAGYAPKAWCGPMDLGLARLSGQDLEIKGKPLCESSDEEWRCASGIMEERRRAIYWLLGHDPVYSENDTST